MICCYTIKGLQPLNMFVPSCCKKNHPAHQDITWTRAEHLSLIRLNYSMHFGTARSHLTCHMMWEGGRSFGWVETWARQSTPQTRMSLHSFLVAPHMVAEQLAPGSWRWNPSERRKVAWQICWCLMATRRIPCFDKLRFGISGTNFQPWHIQILAKHWQHFFSPGSSMIMPWISLKSCPWWKFQILHCMQYETTKQHLQTVRDTLGWERVVVKLTLTWGRYQKNAG